MQKGQKLGSRGKTFPQTPESQENQAMTMNPAWVLHLSPHLPATGGLLWSPYRPPKCWPANRGCWLFLKKKKKIVLFGVKKNWNLESATMVIHVKVPPPQRQDPFKEGKREMGSEGCSKWSPSGKQSSKYRGVSCWVVIASHWLSSCQARISFLLGLAFIVGIESSPFWPPDSVLTQVSVY